ncbi:hypothetical protein H5410_050002, partial [Solanum commersonii]
INSKQNEDCGPSGTQDPDGNKFISAPAADMSAKLMVEVASEVYQVALAEAARQTGGKSVGKVMCIIPEHKLDKTQKEIEEKGLNDMVEFKTGDPVDVNQERSVVVTNNVEGRKGVRGKLKKVVQNEVKVRSTKYPIGKGLEVTMIERNRLGSHNHGYQRGEKKKDKVKYSDKSKWMLEVDENSGEEHIYRMRK